MIIQMNSLLKSTRANKSFMYSFNNENLQYMRNLDQTNEIIRRITELSIEYGILCPYTGLVGVQKYSSEKEKNRVTKMIHDFNQEKTGTISIFVMDIDRTLYDIKISPRANIRELKQLIKKRTGISMNKQRLVCMGRQLDDYDRIIDEYLYGNQNFVHLLRRLIGGGYPAIPARTSCNTNANDLVSIVSEQKVEGCLSSIPSFFSKTKDQRILSNIQKVQIWAKKQRFKREEKKVVATLISLFYMVSYKKELHNVWHLVYKKALKWLNSVNSKVNWEASIKSL